MSTATNNEFYERKSIEEFLGEHKLVRELYEAALEVCRLLPNRERKILRAFNLAYYICMRLTDGSNRLFWEVEFETTRKLRGAEKETFYHLVLSLLCIHDRLLPINTEIFFELNAKMEKFLDWSCFDPVVGKYCGTLTQPINFSGLSHKASAVQREELTDPMQLLERATSDIAKAEERMKTQLAEKDLRIEELADQVKEEQAKVRAREARIKELEKQNASLSSNPFCLVKIKDYAKGLDKEEAKVITHMLLAIALEEQLPKAKQAEVRKAVKEVEAAHKQQPAYVHIAHQEIHNDNQQSQVFNGSITDSKFGK